MEPDCIVMDDASKEHLWSSGQIPSAEELYAHTKSSLDVDEPSVGPVTQAREPLLRRWELRDQELSIPIHNLDLGALGEVAALIPATLFQPYSVPLLLLGSFLLLQQRVFLEVLLGTLLTLATTNTLKAHVGRLRPGPYTLIKRRLNLRSLEKNHAMPSGDAAQAGLWSALAAVHSGNHACLLMIPLVSAGWITCAYLGRRGQTYKHQRL